MSYNVDISSQRINGLSIFSGIGGIDIALSKYVHPIAYCELDPYCQAVLLSRQMEGKLDRAPIWDDVTTLEASILPSDPDVIYGGFPCQNISIAGLGKGLEGEQSRLFFEIVRLAKEIKPTFIFLENVPAITTRGGIQVVKEITEMGYDSRWCVISAASIGAPHKRERWFLLAYSDDKRCNDAGPELASKERSQNNKTTYWDETKSPICGVPDGIPNWSYRIRTLGNAVVPKQAQEAFEILMGIKCR